MSKLNRRSFLASTAAASVPLFVPQRQSHGQHMLPSPGGPVAISSANGLPAVTKAMLRMRNGDDPATSVVAGVNIVENDPNDMSVGYGGLPNEDGVVQLDASVMHGPSHKAGAVAGLENIKNAASVALDVLRRTDHVLLVGEGALRFAKSIGYKEENLLTERAREAWVRWKRNLNSEDDWLDSDQDALQDAKHLTDEKLAVPHTHGTIHCAALDANGDLGACTTTSGLSYKIPGRVGDSPIIGAGMFVDNEVGAAGATGRGEAVIQSCGAFQIVQHMSNGDTPTEACLKVLRWIAAHTKRRMLLNEKGEPGFGVKFYALRKDGLHGGASMHRGAKYAIHDGADARLLDGEYLFE